MGTSILSVRALDLGADFIQLGSSKRMRAVLYALPQHFLDGIVLVWHIVLEKKLHLRCRKREKEAEQ